MATRWLWGFFLVMCLMFIVSGYFRQEPLKNQSIEYIESQRIKALVNQNELDKAQAALDVVNLIHKDNNNLHILYINALVAFKRGDLALAKSFVDKIETLDVESVFHLEEVDYRDLKVALKIALKEK